MMDARTIIEDAITAHLAAGGKITHGTYGICGLKEDFTLADEWTVEGAVCPMGAVALTQPVIQSPASAAQKALGWNYGALSVFVSTFDGCTVPEEEEKPYKTQIELGKYFREKYVGNK
ncbi:MAG: hypothetical protein KGI54_13230 [Pseudomonadota bacterium]|nr:hypothetical protein [Pseudomonadota bacterium]